MRVSRQMMLAVGVPVVCGASLITVAERTTNARFRKRELEKLHLSYSNSIFSTPGLEAKPSTGLEVEHYSDVCAALSVEIKVYDDWLKKPFFAKLFKGPKSYNKAMDNVKKNAVEFSKIPRTADDDEPDYYEDNEDYDPTTEY